LISASKRCRRAPRNWVSRGRLLNAGLALVTLVAAQIQTAPTFRTDVALVHADAEVVEDGRILNGFTKDDFRILDEGKPQPIVQFSAGELPIDLILLFDISGSMHPLISKVASAAQQGLEELRQGDRVAVMVFTTHSRELAPFTDDLKAVRNTIEVDLMKERFRGGTLIQRAVDDAAHRFYREPKNERRRAVLILTDNIGVRTKSEGAVVRDFWEADAMLSGLILSHNPAARVAFAAINPLGTVLSGGMKGIAEKTGGDMISGGDPAANFQESMRRIRTRYSLYYAQPEANSGTMRSIRIELADDAAKKHPRARVRGRTGYRVP
jgi:VWFA-related protein